MADITLEKDKWNISQNGKTSSGRMVISNHHNASSLNEELKSAHFDEADVEEMKFGVDIEHETSSTKLDDESL